MMKIKFELDLEKTNKKEYPDNKELELLTGIFGWMGYEYKKLSVVSEEMPEDFENESEEESEEGSEEIDYDAPFECQIFDPNY